MADGGQGNGHKQHRALEPRLNQLEEELASVRLNTGAAIREAAPLPLPPQTPVEAAVAPHGGDTGATATVFMASDRLEPPPPSEVDPAAVRSFAHLATKTTTAVHDYKYWGGADQPWRHGVDDSPVADAAVIASEEERKLEAEADDGELAGTAAHTEKLRSCGIQVDFLLALTFALDMWEWKTWEVVSYLVKPATEGEGRCRFAHLKAVEPFTGPATCFVVSLA